jgi:hypothetical protein
LRDQGGAQKGRATTVDRRACDTSAVPRESQVKSSLDDTGQWRSHRWDLFRIQMVGFRLSSMQTSTLTFKNVHGSQIGSRDCVADGDLLGVDVRRRPAHALDE